MEIYLQLFITFFKIGLVGFGGGYAMLSMVQYEVVEVHGWLTVGEFTDIVAISQMTPGPIIINCATYIGYTATGGSILGSLFATAAVCLPAIIIMTLICRFFLLFRNNRYMAGALSWMKPTAIGLIAAAALLLMNEHNFVDWRSIVIAVGAFAASYYLRVGTIRLILAAGLAGLLLF